MSIHPYAIAEECPGISLREPVAGLFPEKRTRRQTCAYYALRRGGVDLVGELVERRPGDLLKIPAFGAVCLAEVEHALAAYGLALRGEEIQP